MVLLDDRWVQHIQHIAGESGFRMNWVQKGSLRVLWMERPNTHTRTHGPPLGGSADFPRPPGTRVHAEPKEATKPSTADRVTTARARGFCKSGRGGGVSSTETFCRSWMPKKGWRQVDVDVLRRVGKLFVFLYPQILQNHSLGSSPHAPRGCFCLTL